MSAASRLRNLATVTRGLLLGLLSAQWRARLREAQALERGLPARLQLPLPDALAGLTRPRPDLPSVSPDRLRLLCDTAALLDRRSPLGLCLRRSLVRYHFLRRAGVPVVLQFGAKFKSGQPDRDVAGHARLTLHGEPYYEDGENYEGFIVMFQFPAEDVASRMA